MTLNDSSSILNIDFLITADTDNQTTLGIPLQELATFPNQTDDTESAIFIPSVKDSIERSGAITQWSTYLHQAVEQFYFQVLLKLITHSSPNFIMFLSL